ncbi:helicase HerA-like domain-containing protein [methane-oxidizing endosymbiont of Gigantopelta aegis]|uniref:helicase HerA-like domain-containing protein n=1 Tax=methane-oxidizing endosymbiont of Gigantopelta aegis TaxID=2794938 RepID=UPI0018DD2F52|nr:helicase HerA-like domain-containing protein [methane-oxidizing endosymbiont of Gigantopelta aegis]
MQQILLGGNGQQQILMDAAMGNRHGMISGATGTGKTITLQILAEGFSRLGVPVFLADMKGDLSGIAKSGKAHPKIEQRLQAIKIEDFQFRGNPAVFWDIFGENGHPVRATISDMGPLLLSHLLNLNDTQTGILYSGFKIADDEGLLLLDLKDLRAILAWMAENSRALKAEYGTISSASIGAIQRRLLVLEEQGAEHFFAEPAIELDDLQRVDFSGNGVINILDATRLMAKSPRLYAAFLLWLLSELFETLPEVGDLDKPKMVLFFDEAHLLFDRAPRVLIDKIEQIVRLIRSKGVGVYFVSQSPLDVPEDILGQLGLKIQHALRAYTPKDRKVIKAVAQTFRENPALDTEQAIQALKTGEALISTLNADGSPSQVERVLMRPPESQIGPLTDEERKTIMQRSPVKGRYERIIDRESAYELLKQKAEQRSQLSRQNEKTVKSYRRSSSRSRQSVGEAMLKSAARSIGSQIGRQIMRGILGSLLGRRS